MRLNTQQLHLYSARYSDFKASRSIVDSLQWLDVAEWERYRRYHLDRHRQRFLIGRVLLRYTLSRYRDCAPEDWAFTIGEYGKPQIAQAGNESVHFNLSHSGDLLLILVGRSSELGIDVENSHRLRRFTRIAQRYFSESEVHELLKLTGSEQQRRFYRLWTLKEAYLKARGLGLGLRLDRFSFSFGADGCLDFDVKAGLEDSAARWRFWQFGFGQCFQAAAAASSRGSQETQLRFFHWQSLATVTEQSLPVEWQFSAA